MDEYTKTQLAAVVRELGGTKLIGGGHEYPLSAMLWDMQTALGQFCSELQPGLAADSEAGLLGQNACEFVARADEFLRLLSTTATPDLRFGFEQLESTLAVLRRGPGLVDRLVGWLVRHDEESPLLIDIGPLGRYADGFRQEMDSAANRVKAILSVSAGLS